MNYKKSLFYAKVGWIQKAYHYISQALANNDDAYLNEHINYIKPYYEISLMRQDCNCKDAIPLFDQIENKDGLYYREFARTHMYNGDYDKAYHAIDHNYHHWMPKYELIYHFKDDIDRHRNSIVEVLDVAPNLIGADENQEQCKLLEEQDFTSSIFYID